MKKTTLKLRLGLAGLALLFASGLEANALTDVLEYHGNTSTSTGVNSTEVQITPASVNVVSFGKQFSTSITDLPNITGIPTATLPSGNNYAAAAGQVYGEPLVKTGVTITTGNFQGVHDVVFVTTSMDSLYAIDANGGTILWKDSFIYNAAGNPNPLNPVIPAGVTAVPGAFGTETNSQDIQPWIGIVGTPVIDGVNGYIYFVAKTREANGNQNQPHYVLTLHKVRLADGLDTNIVIADTTLVSSGSYTYNSGPYTIGAGAGSITVSGQSRVYFNAVRQMVRPALVLYGGRLYVASASHGDNGPYHGWLLTYDATTLALNGVWNSTPTGSNGGSGIWQGGGGVVIDPANGYIYFATGNGDFDGSNANNTVTGLDANGFPVNGNYGDCFMKLTLDPSTSQGNQGTNKNGWGLKVVDYFAPYNNNALDSADLDLGSGGPTLLPDAAGSTAHPHLLIGGGKEGKLYLIDRDNMGKFGVTDNVVQTINGSLNGSLSVPAYFNGRLYAIPGYGGVTVSWPLTNAAVTTAGLQSAPENVAFPGCSPYISANGASNGVLWEVDHGTGQLRAYDAGNISNGAIWTSNLNATRDSLGSSVKFSVATAVNGRVYVGTSDHLVVYGPPTPPTSPPAAPSMLAASPLSATAIALSWTDNSNNENSFLIERSSDNVNFTQIAAVAVNVTSYGDSGLSSQATYYYRVRATNSYNTISYSAYSNTSSATTTAVGTQLPNDLYSFDEGSGTATIDSGSGNNGTLTGSTLPKWVSPGRIGTSNLSFSGTGAANVQNQSAVQVAHDLSPLLGTSSSLLFWIKTTQTGNNTQYQAPAVTGVEQAGGGNDIGWGYLNATGKIGLAVGDSGSVTSAKAINDGNWHNVGLTRDATTGAVNVYVDGALSGSGALETGNKTSQFQLIGGRSVVQNDGFTFTGANYLNAQLDDVRIYNVVLSQAFIASLAQAPVAASNLVVTPASGTELDLSWTDNATNATGYEVWSAINGGAYVRLAQLAATATSYVNSSLTQGTTYSYFIRAISPAGSADSPVVTATTPVPPATPTNATVTSLTSTEVDMTWTDNANNEVGYRVLRRTNQANFAQIAQLPANTTGYSDTTVQAGLAYDYHIQAYNIAGVSDFVGFTVTVPTTTSPPPAASNLTATASSGSTVNLAWVDNASNETAYQVWTSVSGGAFTNLVQLAANSTSYAVTGLASGVAYSYFIRVVSPTGTADSSTVSVTTPITPPPPAATNPAATATSGTTVSLSWTDNATNETAYQVWSSINGGTFTNLIQLPANSTSYSVTGLTPGGSYAYFIRVVGAGGMADSTTVSVTTPVATSTVYVSDLAYVGVTNAWGPVEKDMSNGETAAGDGHTITIRGTTFTKGLGCHANSEIDVPLKGTYSTFSSSIGIDDETGGLGSVDFQVLADGVKIYDSGTVSGTSPLMSTGTLNVTGVTTLKLFVNYVGANNGNDHADWAGAQLTTGTVAPPLAATGLTATATSSSTVNLAWTDKATNETAYQVWGSVTGGTAAQIAQLAANSTSYPVTGLTAGTSYTYFVRVISTSGSADSTAVSVTTPSAPPPPPPAATGVTATATSGTAVNLVWTDNATNETAYQVWGSVTGGTAAQIAPLPANSTSYSVTGLTAGTAYTYFIRVINAGGSTDSATASVTTFALPPAATGLTATATSTTTINLAWTDKATNETAYQVWGSVTGGTPAQIIQLPANSAAYSVTGLAAGTSYTYFIRVINPGGSADSATASATTLALPPAATGLTATAASTSAINLAWKDNATNETAYQVWGSVTGGTPAQIIQLPANSISYSVTGLAAGTSYSYFIRVINAGGSADSATVSVTTTLALPPAATGFTATATSDTTVNLSWIDNATNETAYQVWGSVTGGTPAQIIQLPAASTSYSVTGLTAGTSYSYFIRVINAVGSADSTTVPVTTLVTAKVTYVSDLAYVGVTNGWGPVEKDKSNGESAAGDGHTITIRGTTFTKGLGCHANSEIDVPLNGAYSTFSSSFGIDDEVNGLGSVDFQVVADGIKIFDSGTVTGTSPLLGTGTLNVTGVTTLKLFVNLVGANNGNDHADWAGAQFNSGTLPPPPAAATSLTAKATSGTVVSLSWVDNATNETSYQVWSSVSGVTPVQVIQLPANSTSYTATGLTAGSAYSFFVRAINAGGSTDSPTVPVSVPTTVYVSNLAYVGVTNGWGPVEKDLSNGETGAGDGHTISIRGTTFAKGLGCHANSEIDVPLNGAYSTFTSNIGIDDEVNGLGSVDFQVFADGVKIYDSGTVTGTSPLLSTGTLNVKGTTTLKLFVNLVGANNGNDHADWAGAQVNP